MSTFNCCHRRAAIFALWLVSLLLAPAAQSAAGQTPGEKPMPATTPSKKLIEFGWDEPDTAFMRKHIAEMEQTPFNGCVFHINYTKSDGSPGTFLWECWGSRAFQEREFSAAIEDLRQTPLKRFTHNFLRFNTVPGKIDWFDDFSAVLNNARLAAKIAREGRAAGILFDIEQYDGPLFNYRKQRDAGSKSWDEYAEQARRRGAEVMGAFQEGYPDLTIFMTWAMSLPYQQSGGDATKLADCDYGLLAPFLEGMLRAATGATRIVDGFESSYAYKDPSQFDAAWQTMTRGVLSMVADDQKYQQVVSPGFGVWMDYDWRKHGWNEQDFSMNFYTPEQFEKTLAKAWQTTDQYVWIYTETPRWWTADGKPAKLPDAYDQAVRRATGR